MLAYNATTGAELWARRCLRRDVMKHQLRLAALAVLTVAGHGGPTEDVAVSPDSAKVFVAGDTGNDGTTVAYNS